jgi:hypothetical protein
MNATDPMPQGSFSRRDFVKAASLAGTAITSGLGLSPASAGAQPESAGDPAGSSARAKPLIGFQAEVPYLMQFGIERFLDDVQTRASVNALFLHGNLYNASWSGLDRSSHPTGKFAAANPQFYRDVGMQPRGLAPGDFDFPGAMHAITAACRKRGMKIFSWVIEDNRDKLPIEGMDRLYEVDLHGRRTEGHPGGPCLNNPYFRNLLAGEVEDWVRSYDVDGFQRGAERQGPLSNALGAWHHGSTSDPGRVSCFCDYCTAKAKKQGIDTDRVRKGFLALEPYVRNGRAGLRPADGYYVEFWRILLRYPELLAWQTFWSDSMRETQREVYVRVKSIKPEIPVGFHIWQNASFNPIYRAEQDYKSYLEYSDFLKPVVYDNPAAERMASYIYSVTENIYGDLGRQEALEFEYRVMGFAEKSYDEIISGSEAAYEQQLRRLPINGTPTPERQFARFSSDYVFRETRRAVLAVAGTRTKIWPGLGIDVAVKNSTPESVRNAVRAIFGGGGSGMIICTSHAAMRPENLSAAGAALRELKLA